eukprot:SM000141S00877  [mRNA]  locus=s141:88517:90964:- [translate_table: standard]
MARQVACRDYPHARYSCATYPFKSTPHVQHCAKCHCYVCDTRAPCAQWAGHCHATDADGEWKALRKMKKANGVIAMPAPQSRPTKTGLAPPLLPRAGSHRARVSVEAMAAHPDQMATSSTTAYADVGHGGASQSSPLSPGCRLYLGQGGQGGMPAWLDGKATAGSGGSGGGNVAAGGGNVWAGAWTNLGAINLGLSLSIAGQPSPPSLQGFATGAHSAAGGVGGVSSFAEHPRTAAAAVAPAAQRDALRLTNHLAAYANVAPYGGGSGGSNGGSGFAGGLHQNAPAPSGGSRGGGYYAGQLPAYTSSQPLGRPAAVGPPFFGAAATHAQYQPAVPYAEAPPATTLQPAAPGSWPQQLQPMAGAAGSDMTAAWHGLAGQPAAASWQDGAVGQSTMAAGIPGWHGGQLMPNNSWQPQPAPPQQVWYAGSGNAWSEYMTAGLLAEQPQQQQPAPCPEDGRQAGHSTAAPRTSGVAPAKPDVAGFAVGMEPFACLDESLWASDGFTEPQVITDSQQVVGNGLVGRWGW